MQAMEQWRLKAHSLDRYRWLLLRERHWFLGSAIRFVKELLGDLLFGFCAHVRLSGPIASAQCDYLLLQSAPKVIAFKRKKLLIDRLRSQDRVLVETALEVRSNILAGRMLKRPLNPVPLRYFGYAAYAEWLVVKYQPKVVLNDRNGSLYSPFLRLSLNARNASLIHLAHATTVESSRRLGMNDYDYYFIFGQSSLDALKARKLRFGSSRIVLAGSHMIDDAYDLPAADPSMRSLLILGVGPDREKEPGYRETYALLRDWVAANPHYRVLIKAHPRSQVPYWREVAGNFPNLQVLPASCSLAEALAKASLVINIMSNAVVEAALARRPVLYVNVGEEEDIFSQERFLGTRISRLAELDQRIRWIEENYPSALGASRQLAEYHLVHGFAGLERCCALLTAILAGEEISCQPLPGTI